MLETLPRLYQEALDALTAGNRIFVIAHRDPDGDAVGSVLAAGHLLEALGKEHRVAAATPASETYAFLPGYTRLGGPDHLGDHDTVLLLDVGDVERSSLAPAIAARKSSVRVVNVDHHTTKTQFNGENLVDINVLDRRASSTCEMVFRLFERAGITPSKDAATCLLTGIVTDTGMLQNAGTSAAAFEIIGSLMARGANLNQILAATFRNKPVGVLKLWGRALSRLKINRASGIVSTVLTARDFDECGAPEDAADGIANFLLSIREVPVSLVVKDRGDGMVKASFRTTDPTINVADMAAKYGGGGHPRAAGFAVKGRVVETPNGYQVVPE
jgi:phosphoesterase RecJ-like protein